MIQRHDMLNHLNLFRGGKFSCFLSVWLILAVTQALPTIATTSLIKQGVDRPSSVSVVLESVMVSMYRCGKFLLEGRPTTETAHWDSAFTALGFNLNVTSNFDLSTASGIGNIHLPRSFFFVLSFFFFFFCRSLWFP